MELPLAVIVFVCTFLIAWILWPKDRFEVSAYLRVAIVVGFAIALVLVLFGVIRI